MTRPDRPRQISSNLMAACTETSLDTPTAIIAEETSTMTMLIVSMK